MLGIVGFVVYFLPILGGTLADRFGFRRALMFAYLVLTLGYFLLGLLSSPWMQSARAALGNRNLVLLVLLVPALGPSVVKPCVAGTTARASAENMRSIGYSIYYTVVNIGGALGPIIAWLVRKQLGLGIENVFRIAAANVFLMFWVVLFFFREPGTAGKSTGSIGNALENIFVVLANGRFVVFLLISSGFYIVFWQIFVSMPLFIRTYVTSVDPIVVISCQILLAYLTRKLPAVQAIALGFLISGIAWTPLALHPSVKVLIFCLAVVALGEVIQASRYYEYCSRLAPEGQQGLYMGYAFLPIAIGYLIGGPLGGYLVHEFGDVLRHPAAMWWVVAAVNAGFMWIYGSVVKASPTAS